jgi:2-(1,2-epoxy-1,2-dihydrophenyl)acetyl-CoA isomerase
MTEPLILFTRAAAVITLTLNRPAAMNSLTTAMHGELLAGLNQAAEDSSVRCVVITGSGRSFCAGQDLSDPEAAPGRDLGALITTYYKPLVRRIRSMPTPVVAAVNGVAAGAGANLAFCCDLVIAARSANFIQAFSKIGLVPDTGGSWLLPRLAGHARAMGMMLLGEKVSASDAERMGLIWQSVDDDVFASSTAALADKLAGRPTQALVATRQALEKAQSLDLDAALAMEAQLQTQFGLAHDYLEGVDAFHHKRTAVFTDR